MELKAKLKKLAEELGADFFGIANLLPAQEAIEKLWEKVTAQFPRAISFGIALPHDIVNQQPNRFSSNVALNYNHHAYEIINRRLDHIASRLSSVIQKCDKYLSKLEKTSALGVCGMCLYVCPYGRNKINNSQFS